jgi:nicotinamidase-related amidase
VVVIDMQNAYFEQGALAEHRDQLVERTNELIAWALDAGLPVFNVRTQHQRDGSTWTMNMLEDDQGFLFEGDDDVRPLEGLRVEDTIRVVKTRDSSFFETALGEELTTRNIDSIVVAGVSTHTCVAATAAAAYADNIHVVFAEDAIYSHRPELHEPTLGVLCEEYRLDRISHGKLLAGEPADVVRRRPTSPEVRSSAAEPAAG